MRQWSLCCERGVSMTRRGHPHCRTTGRTPQAHQMLWRGTARHGEMLKSGWSHLLHSSRLSLQWPRPSSQPSPLVRQAFHNVESGSKTEIEVARSTSFQPRPRSVSLSLRRASRLALHDSRQIRRLSMTCWSGPYRLSREAAGPRDGFSQFAQGSR